MGAGELYQIASSESRDFHPVLQNLVKQADVEFTVATELSAATQPHEWPASRVTLMGDAVHVMPPTGAHGGNTALRDSACLSRKLQGAHVRSVESAIGEYQNEMIAYSFKEVRQSVAMLRRGNVKNPLARWFMVSVLPCFIL